MQVLGIRFCLVGNDSKNFATFLGDGLGLPATDMGSSGEDFMGAVFPAGDSWIELWPESERMPAMTMLQLVVDDADAWAEQARRNGLKPDGPTDAHGERIYYLHAPNGMPMSFQSRLPA